MPDTIDEKTEQIEFFGKELTITQIANPHLKRLISRKNSAGYNDWSRWRCYGDSDHSDHSEYQVKYHEYGDYAERH